MLSIPRAFVLALVRKLRVITSRACARQRGFFLKEFVSPNLGGAPVVRYLAMLTLEKLWRQNVWIARKATAAVRDKRGKIKAVRTLCSDAVGCSRWCFPVLSVDLSKVVVVVFFNTLY